MKLNAFHKQDYELFHTFHFGPLQSSNTFTPYVADVVSTDYDCKTYCLVFFSRRTHDGPVYETTSGLLPPR